MPLIRDQDGDPAGAICINDCGELARLDQEAVLTVKGQKEGQPMTVLICPVCQYCEWYYGLEEEAGEGAGEGEGAEE